MDVSCIRGVSAAALARFDDVVDWLGIGGGKIQGREYLPLNPRRADAQPGSFSINRDSGHWADFAADEKGGDLVSLAAYLRDEKQGDAARALAECLGIEIADASKRGERGERGGDKPKAFPAPSKPAGGPDSAGGGDTCVMPVPEDAPPPPAAHARHGKPTYRYAYRAAGGAVNFYHDRYEIVGKRKQFSPLTLWRTAGRIEWRFKAPPAPRPAYNLPMLAERSGPVVLVEGEKAADAAAILLPGSPVLTFQGGALAFGKGDYAPFAGREVWLWPDNDAPGEEAMRTAAARLAAAGARPVKRIDPACFAAQPSKDANGILALAQGEPLGAGDDAADLLARGWAAEHVRLALARPDALISCAAAPVNGDSGNGADTGSEAVSWASETSGRRFELTDRGVWYHEPDKAPRWICAWLNVAARGRNPSGGGWAKLVEFTDPDRKNKCRVIPDALLAGDAVELERILRDDGLHVATNGKALLRQYLIEANPKARFRVTNRVGWHKTGSGEAVYVLPDFSFGEIGEKWITQTDSGAVSVFAQHGTVGGWREEIAAPCVGNSRLAFAVSMAFAAPLLYLTGMEGGGFHFRGGSSSGKTTALRVAASVCGGPDYLRRWRATDNALESVALQHCDALLPIDEIAQLDPKAAGETAYMLANGSGKIRANRAGAARETVQWRTLFLSAGEIGLAEHMNTVGKTARAGQEVRLAEISADAGAGLGLFENLHGHESGAAFANALAAACRRNYGGVFIAFLEELVKRQHETLGEIEKAIRQFEAACLTKDAHGQARRAAARFALVGAVGEVATEWGLTGWPQGEAISAARICFQAWLSQRGGEGDADAAAMLAQVRRVLQEDGEARFADWDRPATETDNRVGRTMKRLGYRRHISEEDHYYIFPEMFKHDVCKGHDWRKVAALLAERGYLETGSEGKSRSAFVTRPYIPQAGRIRAFHILPSIADSDSDDD
jgi:uncharacterized protein (DUF927 family)